MQDEEDEQEEEISELIYEARTSSLNVAKPTGFIHPYADVAESELANQTPATKVAFIGNYA